MASVGKPKVDLTGQQFEDYIPIEYMGKGKWLCKCKCGKTAVKLGSHLTAGLTRFCTHNKESTKFKDLSNQRFGRLTVIKYDGESYWICKCDCGETRRVRSWELRQNKILECNRCHYDSRKRKLEGTIVGGYNVIKYIGNKKYICECLNCGEHFEVLAGNLEGNKYGCLNCSNILKMKHKLEGVKIDKLLVKKYIGDGHWLCECDCGNEYIAITSNLIDNKTLKQCKDCYHRSLVKDMTGKDVGDWIVEKYIGYQKWECKCRHCGNTYVRFGWNLRTLKSSVCPCQNSSKPELDVLNYIKSIYNGNIIHKDRNIISPQELDMYIPDKKIAIEFNGTYWHSTKYREKKYHQDKTISCAKRKIQLVHIFEHEWHNIDKQRKIKEYIRSLLTEDNIKVHARKTIVEEITQSETEAFLEEYHLQGAIKSPINLGCFYDNELIGVMTFGVPRFNKNYDYEIHRLCWKSNTTVVGGTERLFKHFIKTYKPQSVITYTDISKFTGNVYTRLGFKPTEKPITEPNYTWVEPHTMEILTRYQTMKHKLIEKGLGTEDQTEDEIMIDNGFLKIYDAGNIKLEWKSIE